MGAWLTFRSFHCKITDSTKIKMVNNNFTYCFFSNFRHLVAGICEYFSLLFQSVASVYSGSLQEYLQLALGSPGIHVPNQELLPLVMDP